MCSCREKDKGKRGVKQGTEESAGERERNRESLVSEKESQIMKGGENKDTKA